MLRIVIAVFIGFVVVTLGCIAFQRKLLYYPTHHYENHGLAEWLYQGQLIGYAREVASPKNVWLMLHGNGGQASDRVYALPSFSYHDSVFILEYPGYGFRPGSPSRSSINAAAQQAYQALRARFPDTPVCVVGESVGSGSATFLAKNRQPPDKIVLIAPFDILSRVAAHHYPILPVGLCLRDNWNNIESLKGYKGVLEVFGAGEDVIIPIVHARALAASVPTSIFHEITGGHNDWPDNGQVRIVNEKPET
ncbi:MAG: alpha/beta hydrolase [Geobacteraceae bacterium]